MLLKLKGLKQDQQAVNKLNDKQDLPMVDLLNQVSRLEAICQEFNKWKDLKGKVESISVSQIDLNMGDGP